MRNEIALACAALLLAGCLHSGPKGKTQPPAGGKNPPQTIIAPDFTTVGRVELVNGEGRFVVLSFPPGHVPPTGQFWRINHRGLKIGRVKISGPQRDMDTVADIIEGNANTGDEAAPE